jgi:hypothetical protein
MADGSVERLRDARNVADTARQSWEDEPSAHLLQPATPAEDRAAPFATALVSIWQPGYVGPVIPLLAVVGMVVALLRPAWRPAVPLGLAALALLFVSAALVGNVSRYRYPADPLLAVLAVGALAWLLQRGRSLVSSRQEGAPTPQLGGSARSDLSWSPPGPTEPQPTLSASGENEVVGPGRRRNAAP